MTADPTELLRSSIKDTQSLCFPVIDSRQPVPPIPTDRELVLRMLANQMTIMNALYFQMTERRR